MKPVRPLVFAVATALAFAAGSAVAAPPAAQPAAAAQPSSSLTPQQRGELTHQFVMKWGVYVQDTYGIDVGTWAKRMGSTFATADPGNFQGALRRSTYEGAMATLDGVGHRLSDETVIDKLASTKGGITPQVLGDIDKDLVFTPIAPCRIIDTRNYGGGAITGGTLRVFTIGGVTDFSTTGGSATDCGMTTQNPKAIVVNLTAVAPAATGFATLYPSGIPTPLAASMIYQGGTTLSNAVTTRVASNDNVRLFSERTVHYVVDLIGYYDAPFATAMECSFQLETVNLIANFRGFVYNSGSGRCPAGYTAASAYCWNQDRAGVYLAGSGTNAGTWCGWHNLNASAQTVSQGSNCCRVPGR